jgi:hypothetical protein
VILDLRDCILCVMNGDSCSVWICLILNLVYYAEWGSRSRFGGNREDEVPSESNGDFILHQMIIYVVLLSK